ncbi:MAG TPA: sulfotransferase [Xanthobacteraceae bacterium]
MSGFGSGLTNKMQVSAKIFCVGANKTGTTSLEAFFKTLGLALGDQAEGELLIRHWAVRNFVPIVELARSAQVFQDMPFSLPFTYVALDEAFPTAKFILSVRDSAEQWYHSLTRFHARLIGKGRLPTANDLKDCPYRHKGWLFEAMQLIYGVSEKEPYEKSRLIAQYEGHNRAVADYFRLRPESLLTLNLAETDAAAKIMSFLKLPFTGETMPHLNRSV